MFDVSLLSARLLPYHRELAARGRLAGTRQRAIKFVGRGDVAQRQPHETLNRVPPWPSFGRALSFAFPLCQRRIVGYRIAEGI